MKITVTDTNEETIKRLWLTVGLRKIAPKITEPAIEEFISLKEEIDAFRDSGYTMGRNYGLNSRGRAVERRYDKQQAILEKYR